MTQPIIEIRQGYVPGALGRVVEICGTYYHDNWGFGLFFEALVASDLAEFLKRYEPARDGFWTAWVNGRMEGHIAVDSLHASEEGAKIRYFVLSKAWHGCGIGNRLMQAAMDFCREAGHKRVYLWTFEGLHAARHLYEKHGFRLVEQRQGSQWGKEVNEQRMVIEF
jgi:GNAT superfamily N-acetyltransferase